MVAFYPMPSALVQRQDPQHRAVSFVDWPPHPAEIAALVDLSMSLPNIAYYLGTPASRVAALLDYYSIQVPADCNIGEAIDRLGIVPPSSVSGFETVLKRLFRPFL